MTDGNVDMSRRAFLGAAAGGAAVAATSGTAAAQTEEPDFGGHIDGVDGGYEDLRGESEVTIEVGAEGNGGNLAFSPAGVWIDVGTTVTWEWTGEGGGHNVVASEGASLDSGAAVSEAGSTYEYTFEEGDAGITKYHCVPHEALGMLGAVAVGGDVPTVSTGGGGGGSNLPRVPDSAKSLGVATTFAMVATLGLAYFFMKYGGDYDVQD